MLPQHGQQQECALTRQQGPLHPEEDNMVNI